MEVIDKWHNTIIDAQVLIPLTLDVWVTVEDNAQARVRLLGCASLWLPMSSVSSLLQPTLNMIVLIGRRANDLLKCIQPELHFFSDELVEGVADGASNSVLDRFIRHLMDVC